MIKVERREILLVDGYNVINAWEELSNLAKESLEMAREKLNFMVAEYVEYHKIEGYIVYDAYNVSDAKIRSNQIGNLHIVFTKEHQTADSYIEKFTAQFKNKRYYTIRVVTDDMAEQQSVLGKGAVRVSSREFNMDVMARKLDMERTNEKLVMKKNTISEILDTETIEILENMRKGKIQNKK